MTGILNRWRGLYMSSKKEYEEHLKSVGARLVSSTIEVDTWKILGAEIEVYSTYATCHGKEVWRAS